MPTKDQILREYLSELGRQGGPKGGKARAQKYSKKQLIAWGKLGGRPKKKKRKHKP